MAVCNFEAMPKHIQHQFKNDFSRTTYAKLQWRTLQGTRRPTEKDLWELTNSTRLEF